MKIKTNLTLRLLSLLLAVTVVAGLLPVSVFAEPVTGVTILGGANRDVFINETIIVTAELTPDNGTYKSIQWTANTELGQDGGVTLAFATSPTCQVTGVTAGYVTLTITVSFEDGTSITASCIILVREQVMASAVELNTDSVQLSLGGDRDTFQLIATVSPDSATNKNVNWTTSDASIVSISASSGSPITITALKVGVATITARSADGSNLSAVCRVAVTTPPTEIVLDSNASVVVGKSMKLPATVTPTTADNKTIVWLSSDDTVARVDYEKGTITGVSVGNCVITAFVEGYGPDTENPVLAKCNLEVTISDVPVKTLVFNISEATVIEKKTTPLVVNITPTNASNKKLQLVSSDITFATVPATVNAGSSFNVTGVKPGKVTITAISAEDNTIVAKCEVTIIATPTTPVTAMTLNTTANTLVVGGTVTPKATLTPSTASIKTITWESSNPDVAAVDTSGKITATGPGVATITATADGGTGIKATCVVNVVSLNSSALSLKQNDKYTLTVANLPSASGLSVGWATSKTSVATISSASGTNTTITAQGAGEATITATVKLGNTTVATLKCVVSVTAAADTINYQVAGTETIALNVNDFNTVCTNASGNALNYVKFSLPDSDEGTLYYMYDKAGETKLSSGTFYYRASAPKISDVTFVPASAFSGKTIISYTAVDAKGNTYTGTISIMVGDSTGDIKYSTGMGKPVSFMGADFNEYCEKVTGNTLSSVKFTLPKATEGVLYYLYELDSSQKILGTKITAATNYYYGSSPGISDLTFLPANNFVGSVDIKFTGRDSQTNPVSGTVRITVGKGTSSGADIEYRIDKNEILDLVLDDFNDFCRGVTGANLNYVRFSLPSALRGTLYYDYSVRTGKGTAVTATRRYYRNSSPYLEYISFVPVEDYEGTLTFAFTGISVGGQEVTGTVAIIVGEGYGDIRYSAGINVPISFDNDKFNEFCKGETGANFDYIQFSLPKNTEGIMYHQYGRSGETVVTAGSNYYRTAARRLDEITFIPTKDFTGVIEFAFTGRSVTGINISGTIALTYDPNLLGTPIIYYSTDYAPVTFKSADFVDANANRGAASLTSVEFILPPTSVGRLYTGYKSHYPRGTAVAEDNTFATGSGTASVSGVTFVPRAGTTGSVAIPYIGTDSKGDTFTGYVQISIPTVVVSSFSDMDKHTWAAASVEYMRYTGVVGGIGNNKYGPGNAITRGDFMLMLYRAFSLSARGSDNFSDVPSNSYYAQAIAAAKSMGIALGGADGKFRPNDALTRQDAMVLIHRLLDYLDWDVEEASESYLNGFSDGRSVSSYARYAVADLIYAGIIQGDDKGRLNPLNSVTRAEMAVILHRVLTY